MINRVGDEVDGAFAALADPTRRRVVELLRQAPRRAGELADDLAMSRPALSRHLRVLRVSGLVEAQALTDDARGRMYRLLPDKFTALQAWLDQVQAFWAEQLGSFSRHVDGGQDQP
jgi:DNA-binding transcriptional ArsR family regulator